jgi:haloacetate dehalogenase
MIDVRDSEYGLFGKSLLYGRNHKTTEFSTRRLQHVAGRANIRVLSKGDGPPLLLIHGHPETHVSWHKIASQLAEHYTVILPDLRGYGDSSKPG